MVAFVMFCFRNCLKLLSWLLTLVWWRKSERVVLLMYHRVSGNVNLELDLVFSDFKKQIDLLAATHCVISLDEAIDRVTNKNLNGKTWYVITFDDAYDDFYSHVFPLICKHGIPVTLYVPTGFLDQPDSPPVSRITHNIKLLRPISWLQLKEIANSQLITIGGHTHSHQEMTSLSDSEALSEVERCDYALASHLGKPIRHFAYPRGVWNSRIERLLAGRYESIALVGGGSLMSASFNSQRLPRVPVLRSDGMRWFKARLAGRLIIEEQIIFFANRYKWLIRLANLRKN